VWFWERLCGQIGGCRICERGCLCCLSIPAVERALRRRVTPAQLATPPPYWHWLSGWHRDWGLPVALLWLWLWHWALALALWLWQLATGTPKGPYF